MAHFLRIGVDRGKFSFSASVYTDTTNLQTEEQIEAAITASPYLKSLAVHSWGISINYGSIIIGFRKKKGRQYCTRQIASISFSPATVLEGHNGNLVYSHESFELALSKVAAVLKSCPFIPAYTHDWIVPGMAECKRSVEGLEYVKFSELEFAVQFEDFNCEVLRMLQNMRLTHSPKPAMVYAKNAESCKVEKSDKTFQVKVYNKIAELEKKGGKSRRPVCSVENYSCGVSRLEVTCSGDELKPWLCQNRTSIRFGVLQVEFRKALKRVSIHLVYSEEEVKWNEKSYDVGSPWKFVYEVLLLLHQAGEGLLMKSALDRIDFLLREAISKAECRREESAKNRASELKKLKKCFGEMRTNLETRPSGFYLENLTEVCDLKVHNVYLDEKNVERVSTRPRKSAYEEVEPDDELMSYFKENPFI